MKSYDETQTATARLKSVDALKLTKMGRIKIGWIYARMKTKINAIRYFRCLGYGYTRHKCKGLDRTEACSLCNNKDHKASACHSNPNCAAYADLKEPTNDYPGSRKCTVYRIALINKRTPEVNEPR